MRFRFALPAARHLHPLFLNLSKLCANRGNPNPTAKPSPPKAASIQLQPHLSTRRTRKSTTPNRLPVRTVYLPVPNPPLQPRFPLPLNSTAKFSKKHPYLNLAPVAVYLPISTFPTPTVTTAGLNISLFISFPYSVSTFFLIHPANQKPFQTKTGTIPEETHVFMQLVQLFHLLPSLPFTTINTGRSHIFTANPIGVQWHHVR
jgi:hypothetical protein